MAALLSLLLLSPSARLNAAAPQDYRINVLRYGLRSQATLNRAVQELEGGYGRLYIPGGTWTFTNSMTIPANVTLEASPAARLSVQSGRVLTFSDATLAAPGVALFAGSGVVTGTVFAADGCWTEWNGLANSANYYLVCYPDAVDQDMWRVDRSVIGDWVHGTLTNFVITNAAGDVSGPLTNLSIGVGVITSNNIATNGISWINIDTNSIPDGGIPASRLTTNELDRSYIKIGGGVMPVMTDVAHVIYTTNITHYGATTGQWFTADCSGWIPDSAYAALVHANFGGADVGKAGLVRLQAYVRRDSDMTAMQVGEITLWANVVSYTTAFLPVPLTTNQTFQYLFRLYGGTNAVDSAEVLMVGRGYY